MVLGPAPHRELAPVNQFQKGLHYFRLVVGTTMLLHLGRCLDDTHCRSMGAIGDHRFDHVGDAENACFDGNIGTRQFVGIAAAVEMLMVLQDYLRYWPRKIHMGQELVADLRVFMDGSHLFWRECSRFAEYFLGDSLQAYIMQQGTNPKSGKLMGTEAEFSANGAGEISNTVLMIRIHGAARAGRHHEIVDGESKF